MACAGKQPAPDFFNNASEVQAVVKQARIKNKSGFERLTLDLSDATEYKVLESADTGCIVIALPTAGWDTIKGWTAQTPNKVYEVFIQAATLEEGADPALLLVINGLNDDMQLLRHSALSAAPEVNKPHRLFFDFR